MNAIDLKLIIATLIFLLISLATLWLVLRRRSNHKGSKPLVNCELGEIMNLGIGGAYYSMHSNMPDAKV